MLARHTNDSQLEVLHMRLIVGSGLVCVVSWLALAAGAGNVGLQQSISKGPASLLDQPMAIVLVAATALVAGFAATRLWTVRPIPLVAAVLVGDLIAGVVLAPIAVGELEPIHAPIVFAAVSVLGLQPLSALVGSLLAARTLPEPA